jgi:predicted RNA-binding protein with EMAP domain
MNILDLIAYVTYSAVTAALIVMLVKSKIRHKKLLADSLQLALDKVILLKMMEDLAQNKEDESVEKTEGFLKFVSDSRDWAFDYIEKAQTSVQQFGNTIEPMLAEDFLGIENINDLAKAYANLITILPENNKGIKNDKV